MASLSGAGPRPSAVTWVSSSATLLRCGASGALGRRPDRASVWLLATRSCPAATTFRLLLRVLGTGASVFFPSRSEPTTFHPSTRRREWERVRHAGYDRHGRTGRDR